MPENGFSAFDTWFHLLCLLYSIAIQRRKKKTEKPNAIHPPPVEVGDFWLIYVKTALDPQDRDHLAIEPHPLVAAFLEAARQLGFRLRHVQCEQAPRYWQQRLPFVQEFEFKPASGPFKGRLDELEAIFFVSEHGVEAILEIDRKARGFAGLLSEALDMDETLVRFTYGPSDVASLAQWLANAISRYS
nr:sporulation protein [Geobacillus stearothermophilus]